MGANAPKTCNAPFTMWKDADAGVPILSQAKTDTLRSTEALASFSDADDPISTAGRSFPPDTR